MIHANSHSNDRTVQKPVFIVSHSKQEKICKEVYDYLIYKKLLKLKEAVLHFNKVIGQILK